MSRSFWPPGDLRVVGGARVMSFPTDIYNFYYFDENIPDSAKILHFRGSLKHEALTQYRRSR